MPTRKATHWSLIAFTLALPLCFSFSAVANASIQLTPASNFNACEPASFQDDSSSSSPDPWSSEVADDSNGGPEGPRELELLWHALNSSTPSSSGSSSSTPVAGGITLFTVAVTQVPDIDDQAERVVCEDAIISFSEFVTRLLRPPRVS